MTARFGELWAGGDRDAAHDELDRLAAAAPSSDAALSELLTLVHEFEIARPAIRRMVIDHHDIDEIEAAVLAVVATKIETFAGRSRFATWLHQVATNETKMFIRARSRRPADPVADLSESAFVTRLSSLVGTRVTIDAALAELPDAARQVLILRELEALSYDEIATALDIEVGTVRSRLSRARGQLAASLSPTDESDQPAWRS